MILWCDGAHDAAENMRRDAALLERVELGALHGPVLRLFRFEPVGITLGASQAPDRMLDLERCRRDGIVWAVRPTGGRAIFHAEEWTYSFAARIDDPDWGGTLLEAYAAVSRLLVASLVRLGVPVERATASNGGFGTRLSPAREEAPAFGSVSCFATTSGHEIVLGGRKLVGSAQRRLARALVQQGSLLLGEGHLRLADYVRADEGSRRRLREDLARRTAHAARWLGNAPLERWAGSLAESLPERPERVDGERGLESLTLREAGSYTPPVPTSPVAPSRRAP